jgi:hypothetical protein
MFEICLPIREGLRWRHGEGISGNMRFSRPTGVTFVTFGWPAAPNQCNPSRCAEGSRESFSRLLKPNF